MQEGSNYAGVGPHIHSDVKERQSEEYDKPHDQVTNTLSQLSKS